VQPGESQPSSTDSGGSSPLVPILIAVAVLAAISVGAVLVRQRRGSAGGVSLKRG
jgi:MYXO-CTERM domain-containing protein